MLDDFGQSKEKKHKHTHTTTKQHCYTDYEHFSHILLFIYSLKSNSRTDSLFHFSLLLIWLFVLYELHRMSVFFFSFLFLLLIFLLNGKFSKLIFIKYALKLCVSKHLVGFSIFCMLHVTEQSSSQTIRPI